MADADLFLEFKKNESLKVRNEIIKRNQPLITFIINKYYSKKTFEKHKDDLIQEGVFGLMDAIGDLILLVDSSSPHMRHGGLDKQSTTTS